MWLHSGHYNSNPSKGINNRDPIIEAINPRGNSTTKALSRTTSWQLNTKAPTTPEMVKFCVFFKILNHSQEEC